MRKAPRPTNAVSARLELVRQDTGFATLKDFWKELTKDPDFDVSYEAARNYHFDRDPSFGYLRQVKKRFGIRLEWLIDGSEPRTEKEAAASAYRGAATTQGQTGSAAVSDEPNIYKEVATILAERVPEIGMHVPTFLRGALLEVWQEMAFARHFARNPQQLPAWPPPSDLVQSTAEDLAAALMAPVSLIKPAEYQGLGKHNSTTYFLGMTQALLSLLQPFNVRASGIAEALLRAKTEATHAKDELGDSIGGGGGTEE